MPRLTDDAERRAVEPEADAVTSRPSRASWCVAHAGVVAAAGWAAVWGMLLATGQDYSLRVLYAGWQMLPHDALVDDPFGSVWHLHTQPPLWNLQAGMIGAWSPVGQTVGHASMSLVAGCVLAGSICSTLRRFGASAGLAWVLTAAATLNTQLLVYAFRPQYDLAVAALLAALVWSVARVDADDLGWVDALLPVSLATTLVLTRALYHPVWLAAVLGLLGWRWRHRLRVRYVVVGVAIPLVTIGAWIVKNEAEFGRPTMSSWTGMNLLRATLPAVDPDRVAELRADGTLSDVAVVGSFRAYVEYADSMPPCAPEPPAHRALRIEMRYVPNDVRTGGAFDRAEAPNFNFECYLDVYDRAGDDAWALMRHEPGAWLTARAWAANNWFEAPPMRPPGASPLWRPLDEVSRVGLLALPHPGLPAAWEDDPLWAHRSRWSLALLVAVVAVLVDTVRRNRRARGVDPGDAADRGRATAMAIVAITVGWTMFAGIVAELGEQQRFRSVTDPMVLALGGLAVVELVRARRRRGGVRATEAS